MNAHERFHAACEHRTSDRPPVDYLTHPETDRKLRATLGVTSERELLDRLGGYICAPSQILGPDIPVENILFMYETIAQSGGR